MTDTVKLIIEIPKDAYSACRALRSNDDQGILTFCVVNAVANGTPLDDVKAEIKSWYWQVEKQSLAKDPCVVDAMVDLFIRTIDNIDEAESQKLADDVGFLNQSLEDAIDCS